MMDRYKVEERFNDYMEQLARKHERSRVYVDFMDYYIQQNSDTPGIRDISDYYDEEDMACIHNAYNSFRELMQEILKEEDWHDYIGEYYESYILAGSKASSKGQFYTPKGISDLLSKLVGVPCQLAEAYDPACGSARNLLDYHSKHKGVRCIGEDLDESACKMAVINFHLHGVDGIVHWIDALTREYMGTSWRILGDRIYVTDMDMIQTMDEVMGSVSLLMMSDEVLKKTVEALQHPKTVSAGKINSNTKMGGLDERIQK